MNHHRYTPLLRSQQSFLPRPSVRPRRPRQRLRMNRIIIEMMRCMYAMGWNAMLRAARQRCVAVCLSVWMVSFVSEGPCFRVVRSPQTPRPPARSGPSSSAAEDKDQEQNDENDDDRPENRQRRRRQPPPERSCCFCAAVPPHHPDGTAS